MLLQDFKLNVLGPLLRGEIPTNEAPLALFAAELDRPVDYLFESDRWDEISGAAARLANASAKILAILAADGYASVDLLHADGSSILALVHDQSVAQRWIESI